MSHYPPLGPLGTTRDSNHPYFIPGIEDSDALDDDAQDDVLYGFDDYAKNVPRIGSGRPSQNVGRLSEAQPASLDDEDVDRDFLPMSDGDSAEAHQLSPSPEGSDQGRRGWPNPRGRKRGARGGRGQGTRGRPPKSNAIFTSRTRDPDAAPRGERRRGKRGSRRGPRVADPGREFQNLQTRATTAFMDDRYEEAADLCLEAIQVNPEMFASYSLISEIYAAWDKPREAHEALWDGAFLQNDPELWFKLADTIMSYTDVDYGKNRRDRLLRCYSEIIKKDHANVEARRGRLELFIEQGRHNRAVQECEAMLGHNPYDMVALQCLAASSLEESIPSVARTAYQKAIRHFQSEEGFQDYGELEEDGKFSLADLNDYIELYMHGEEHGEGIKELKHVARWLLGRDGESYWDDMTGDDREWDDVDDPRRLEVPEFVQGAYALASYGEGLPMELRSKLGILRLRQGSIDEAMLHFERFTPEARDPAAPVIHFPESFRDIGNELSDTGHHALGLRFFEALFEMQIAYRHPDILRRMAVAYVAGGIDEQAILFYKRVLERMPGSTEDGIELARLYEKHERREEALDQVREMLLRGGHSDVKESGLYYGNLMQQIKPPPRRVYNRKPRFPPADVPKGADGSAGPVADILETVVPETKGGISGFRTLGYPALRRLHARLVELSPLVREGEDADATGEWMKIAEVLVDQFSQAQVVYTGSEQKPFVSAADSTKKFGAGSFIRDYQPLNSKHKQSVRRAEEAVQSREIIDEHAGVPFEQWLDVHCEYALLLSKRSKRQEAYDLLQQTEDTKIFGQDDLCLQTIHVCRLACAIASKDEEQATVSLRWWVKAYGHASDIWRVYNLFSINYPNEPNWFNAGPAQKYWMRVVKGHDYALMNPKQRKATAFSLQEKAAFVKSPYLLNPDPSAPEGNTQSLPSLDPTLLLFYGHLLATNGSYSNALQYFFRAYAICPTHPLTLFSIATAYIQVAMKRVAENRHYSILLGFAFLGAYRRERLKGLRRRKGMQTVWRQRRMEVAFNEARAWHFLGLGHLAVPKYWRCLELAEGADVLEDSDSDLDDDDDDGDTAMADADDQQTQAEAQAELRDEPDYSREAALALQQMMALAGNMGEARRIGEKWLAY